MSFVKNMWADLVEKRLWPVALLLLLALIAIPVLLGPSGDAATTADVGTTGAAGAPAALVSLEADTPLRADRLGTLRDPFKQAALPKVSGPTGATGASGPRGAAADLGSSAAAGGGDASADAPDAPDTPSAGGGTTGSRGSAEPKAPKADSRDSYAAVLRFGITGSKRPQRSVQRLTPLPSAENPYFVYLGVEDGKVVLLLSEEVKATGDGACKPSATSCESVALVPGDTEFLEVTDDAGKVTQYQLDLKRIDTGTASAPGKAVAARSAG